MKSDSVSRSNSSSCFGIDAMIDEPLEMSMPASRTITSTRKLFALLDGPPDRAKLVAKLERAAASNETVLLIGESGTGKELLANAIHQNSSRAEGNFVPINNDSEREAGLRVQADYESRSSFYVIGTSLVFELVVLAGACFVFVRRDY